MRDQELDLREDRLSYIRLLRFQGLRGKKLRWKLYRMTERNLEWVKLIHEKPIAPHLRENDFTVIDYRWVLGETCSEIFDKLTRTDRWFLYLFYHYGLAQTRQILGLSRTSCYRVMVEIRKRITGANRLRKRKAQSIDSELAADVTAIFEEP